MMFFSERTIEIDGVQVRVREAGDGPALVILGQSAPTPLGLQHLQVDEEFIHGAHPAEVVAGPTVENSQAKEI